jgi:hypothetical protein
MTRGVTCHKQEGQPTGQRVSWGSVDITHVRGGQFVSHFGLQDGLGLMQQLGVVPAPGQATG